MDQIRKIFYCTAISLLLLFPGACDLLELPKNNQKEEEEWGKKIELTENCDEFLAIEATGDNNFIAVGYANRIQGMYREKGYVRKFDIEGNLICEQFISDKLGEDTLSLVLNDVLLTSDGNYLVLGTVSGPVYNPDFQFIKKSFFRMISSDGETLWERSSSADKTETITGAILLNDSEFCTLGTDDEENLRIATYSLNSGELIWEYSINYSGESKFIPGSICLSNNGDILVAASRDLFFSTGMYYVYLFKMENSNGIVKEAVHYSDELRSTPDAVTQLSDGRVVISGYQDAGPESHLLLLSFNGDSISSKTHLVGSFASGTDLKEYNNELYMCGYAYSYGYYGQVAKIDNELNIDLKNLQASYTFNDESTLIKDFVFDGKGGMLLVGTTDFLVNEVEAKGNAWITRIYLWEEEE